MQREQQRYRAWPWTRRWRSVLVVGLWLGLVIGAGAALARSGVEQRPAPRGAQDSAHPTQSQEHFLQHFISRSLGQEEAKDPSLESLRQQPAPAPQHPPATAAASKPATPPTAHELTTATTTMLLALGGILALLSAGGYLVRRYFPRHAAFGKRGTPLRVLGRVNLTPKAAVALLEVPGKLLVIGITSSTLTALGEVAGTALEAPETSADTRSASFADTLEQQTLPRADEAQTDDTLLQVPEAIQRMVSGLKRL